MESPTTKPWWQSKIIWFNALGLLVAIANIFGFASFTPGPEMEQVTLVVITVVNLVLRLVTSKPVAK